jgi:hypothetical protein
MGADDVAGDGQAEAGAGFSRLGRFKPAKGCVGGVGLVQRNSGAAIPDFKPQAVLAVRC